MSEISQELAHRMAACLRRYASGENNIVGGMSVFAEANSIVAELPVPVDPDLLLAREIALDHALPATFNGLTSSTVRAGRADREDYMNALVVAIKRGRELAGERP